METTFTCPHCAGRTEHPRAELIRDLDSLTMSRIMCEHCDKEFLIVDNRPMTEAEYQRRNPAVQ